MPMPEQMQMNYLSAGIIIPVLGYVVSCLGAFLGFQCIGRARAHAGSGARFAWLVMASIAIGVTAIWTMDMIALCGFSVPGQAVLFSQPMTVLSMLASIAVTGIGLSLVVYGRGSAGELLLSGSIVGAAVGVMHYTGMAAIQMQDDITYDLKLAALAVACAVVFGTVALWFGLQSTSKWRSLAGAILLGIAVTGMYFISMASMRMTMNMSGTMPASGAAAISFLLPLLIGSCVVTFVLAMIIALSPTADEIREDISLRQRISSDLARPTTRR